MENVSLQSLLDETDIPYRDWYPALNVSPDGSLFDPGQMPELFSIDIEGDHDSSVHSHGDRDDDPLLYNTTVMYDVGKMLVAVVAMGCGILIPVNGHCWRITRHQKTIIQLPYYSKTQPCCRQVVDFVVPAQAITRMVRSIRHRISLMQRVSLLPDLL